MSHKRSIEAQRARLLSKKSGSKPMSDKFVKKEIINLKYGIKKPQASRPFSGIAIFVISFFVILVPGFLLLPAIVAFAVAALGGALVVKLRPKKQIAPRMENYHIHPVVMEYEHIMTIEMKNHILSINSLMENLSAQKLNAKEAYYVESNMLRDIPELFKNFKALTGDLEAQQKTTEALGLIEQKLTNIRDNYSIDYKRNLEIKKRVITQKAGD